MRTVRYLVCRALCYYAGLRDPTLVGQFALDLVPEGEVGQVYGLAYDKTGMVYTFH